MTGIGNGQESQIKEKRMGFFNNPLPGYLRGKNQLIYTVTFTALFSIVFLLVSLPFSHNS